MSVSFHFEYNFNDEDLNILVDKYNIDVEFIRVNNSLFDILKIKMLVHSIADESQLSDFMK